MSETTIRGRTVVLALFGVALAMSAGAWFYHFQAGRQSAQFWGAEGGRLVIAAPVVRLHRLHPPQEVASDDFPLPHQSLTQTVVLSDAPGFIHFRHALTQDANYLWDQRSDEPLDARDWQLAIEFVDPPRNERLWVVLGEGAALLGKVEEPTKQIAVLPCPRMAEALRSYLNAP